MILLPAEINTALTLALLHYEKNGYMENDIVPMTCCLDNLTSVCFHKFTSSNHLILFCRNKTASGAIIAGKNCNKVHMLTGLVPALLKRVDSSTNSLNVSRAAFEISSYSFWEGYRLTGLIICDKTLLYSPLQKTHEKHEGEVVICEIVKVEKVCWWQILHKAWVGPLAWFLFYGKELRHFKTLFFFKSILVFLLAYQTSCWMAWITEKVIMFY